MLQRALTAPKFGLRRRKGFRIVGAGLLQQLRCGGGLGGGRGGLRRRRHGVVTYQRLSDDVHSFYQLITGTERQWSGWALHSA